jgi:hypothetical protein
MKQYGHATDLAQRIIYCWENWDDTRTDDPLETLAREAKQLIERDAPMTGEMKAALGEIVAYYDRATPYPADFTIDEIVHSLKSGGMPRHF